MDARDIDDKQDLPMKIDLNVRVTCLQRLWYLRDAQSLKLLDGQNASPFAAFDLLKGDQRVAQRDVIPLRVQIDPVAELIEKLSGLRNLGVGGSLSLLFRYLHRRTLLII